MLTFFILSSNNCIRNHQKKIKPTNESKKSRDVIFVSNFGASFVRARVRYFEGTLSTLHVLYIQLLEQVDESTT